MRCCSAFTMSVCLCVFVCTFFVVVMSSVLCINCVICMLLRTFERTEKKKKRRSVFGFIRRPHCIYVFFVALVFFWLLLPLPLLICCFRSDLFGSSLFMAHIISIHLSYFYFTFCLSESINKLTTAIFSLHIARLLTLVWRYNNTIYNTHTHTLSNTFHSY